MFLQTEMRIGNSEILTGSDSLNGLKKLLKQKEFTGARKVVLVDEQTLQLCLPVLLSEVSELTSAEIIEVESGEASKNIEVCTEIWSALSDLGADRSSVLVNLGGGVITDMGGFIASCFMRGVRFINVPTTLLAQVDAAIGGKTGVDLGNLKNHVGVFSDAEAVVVSTKFLRSLGKRELLAGFAEMLKHALISDPGYWTQLKSIDFSDVDDLGEPVMRSIERKSSNVGEQALAEITETLLSLYKRHPIDDLDYNRIIEIMRHDKKNVNGELNFTFLEAIGQAKVNCTASAQDVKHALNYYSVHSSQVAQ